MGLYDYFWPDTGEPWEYAKKERKEIIMAKVAVVYWSGTGNTETMAASVAEGVKEKGGQVFLMTCGEFDASMMDSYDAIAFGCPSMGSEQLEESEFEPMFDSCKSSLKDKRIALFGSYGWGSGEWMQSWEDTCREEGAVLVCDSVICNEAPDEEGLENCKALGGALA